MFLIDIILVWTSMKRLNCWTNYLPLCHTLIWCFITWPTLGLFWTIISIVTLSLLVQWSSNNNPNIEVLSSSTFFAQLLYFNWIKVYRFIVLNVPFNNISVISWRSVLLVEETGVPSKNHLPVASHWQTLSHNVVSSTPRHERSSNSQL